MSIWYKVSILLKTELLHTIDNNHRKLDTNQQRPITTRTKAQLKMPQNLPLVANLFVPFIYSVDYQHV